MPRAKNTVKSLVPTHLKPSDLAGIIYYPRSKTVISQFNSAVGKKTAKKTKSCETYRKIIQEIDIPSDQVKEDHFLEAALYREISAMLTGSATQSNFSREFLVEFYPLVFRVILKLIDHKRFVRSNIENFSGRPESRKMTIVNAIINKCGSETYLGDQSIKDKFLQEIKNWASLRRDNPSKAFAMQDPNMIWSLLNPERAAAKALLAIADDASVACPTGVKSVPTQGGSTFSVCLPSSHTGVGASQETRVRSFKYFEDAVFASKLFILCLQRRARTRSDKDLALAHNVVKVITATFGRLEELETNELQFSLEILTPELINRLKKIEIFNSLRYTNGAISRMNPLGLVATIGLIISHDMQDADPRFSMGPCDISIENMVGYLRLDDASRIQYLKDAVAARNVGSSAAASAAGAGAAAGDSLPSFVPVTLPDAPAVSAAAAGGAGAGAGTATDAAGGVLFTFEPIPMPQAPRITGRARVRKAASSAAAGASANHNKRKNRDTEPKQEQEPEAKRSREPSPTEVGQTVVEGAGASAAAISPLTTPYHAEIADELLAPLSAALLTEDNASVAEDAGNVVEDEEPLLKTCYEGVMINDACESEEISLWQDPETEEIEVVCARGASDLNAHIKRAVITQELIRVLRDHSGVIVSNFREDTKVLANAFILERLKELDLDNMPTHIDALVVIADRFYRSLSAREIDGLNRALKKPVADSVPAQRVPAESTVFASSAAAAEADQMHFSQGAVAGFEAVLAAGPSA